MESKLVWKQSQTLLKKCKDFSNKTVLLKWRGSYWITHYNYRGLAKFLVHFPSKKSSGMCFLHTLVRPVSVNLICSPLALPESPEHANVQISSPSLDPYYHWVSSGHPYFKQDIQVISERCLLLGILVGSPLFVRGGKESFLTKEKGKPSQSPRHRARNTET